LLRAITKAGSGHPGGSLSVTDILTALYFKVLNVDHLNPSWEDRDRFILSNGHACPALYTTLAYKGFFHKDELASLRELGSRLQGHPEMHRLPGLENTSGPLGQGLSFAVGKALAGKRDHKHWRVFCLASDAEHQEGQTWEAVMFAAHFELNNLCVIVDNNNVQISGHTRDVMNVENLKKKYEAFNWHTVVVNGHNFKDLLKAFQKFEKSKRPMVIIANTVLGRGVPFMEHNPTWHGKAPNKRELERALKELEE
jgi:transketolase